jgi:hypothetical protein
MHCRDKMISVTDAQRPSGGMGMGMRPIGGMMQRHHATIPDEYTDVSAPESSEESIERGAELYAAIARPATAAVV